MFTLEPNCELIGLNEGMILGEGNPLLVVLEDSERRYFSFPPKLFPLPIAEGGNSSVSESFKFPFACDSCNVEKKKSVLD